MIVFPDPWEALCIARQLPERSVIAFAATGAAEALADAGIEATLVEPEGELLTLTLLTHAPTAADPKAIIAFKPSARLEGSGYHFALAPSAVAGGIENKLNLSGIAEAAGVRIAAQGQVRVGDESFDTLSRRFGLPFVAQSPRGFAGKRSFRIDVASDWEPVVALLRGRPMKVASWADGQPGTSNAVVDHRGTVMVSAPILQLTGETDLTPHPLGSCGNDFTWRPSPHPGSQPAEVAEALGPVLAGRGYRGHFGIDWVWDGKTCTLIEINARLTASFGLYVSHRPELLHAHLRATGGEAIEAGRLAPFEGGQLVVYNVSEKGQDPLTGPSCWPAPGGVILPGAKRGRKIIEGPVVDKHGTRLIGGG